MSRQAELVRRLVGAAYGPPPAVLEKAFTEKLTDSEIKMLHNWLDDERCCARRSEYRIQQALSGRGF
jgi:hypothetical protein